MVKNSGKQLATSQRLKWQKQLQQIAASHATGQLSSLRVVIDTNIWYSALVYGGRPEVVVTSCLQQHTVVLSQYILGELTNRLKIKANAPYRWLRLVRLYLERVCIVAHTDNLPAIVRDPKDDHVIAAAISEKCQLIITGDRDLLSLQEHEGVLIVTAQEYLELF